MPLALRARGKRLKRDGLLTTFLTVTSSVEDAPNLLDA
jgi:hypothetical protein